MIGFTPQFFQSSPQHRGLRHRENEDANIGSQFQRWHLITAAGRTAREIKLQYHVVANCRQRGVDTATALGTGSATSIRGGEVGAAALF